MLFGADDGPRRFAIVDWQTVGWGPATTDVSYFLGGSLAVEDRRAHEYALVREYHDALHAHGVRGFDWDRCWDGYRRQSFLGIVMTVGPAVLVERTDRGDEMFLASLSRYAQQNESWYFDAVSEDGRTGVYARLGLHPNLGVSWLTAFVCGPDRPTAACSPRTGGRAWPGSSGTATCDHLRG